MDGEQTAPTLNIKEMISGAVVAHHSETHTLGLFPHNQKSILDHKEY